MVYRARQETVGRTVAVKVLSLGTLGEQERRRFERECQALGAVSGHPNIVAIFDSGTSGEQRPYLIMDYLSGGTLADGLQRDGPVPWQVAADLGVKVAGALAAAHAAGVLHRDVKPENVLMSAYGEPQLVDFGIARLTGASHSRTGEITATLAHAAPEVLAGEPASEASDVYSLASTLYELLSGQPPFVRSTDETFHPLLARVLSEDPPDLRATGVPAAICDALDQALAKDPTVRTPSAHAFAEALRHAQRVLGEQATPLIQPPTADSLALAQPGDQERTQPRARPERPRAPEPAQPAGTSRRRWLVAAAGASAILLAAAIVAIMSNGQQARTIGASTTATTTTTTAPANTSSRPAAPTRTGKETAPRPTPGPGQDTPPPPDRGRSGGRVSPPPPPPPPSRPARARSSPAKRKQTTRKPTRPATPATPPPAVTPPPPPPAAPTPDKLPPPAPKPRPAKPPPAKPAPAKPRSPTRVCGAGYYVQRSHALPGAIAYQLYNGTYNCAVTIKTTSIGTRTLTGAGVHVAGSKWTYDVGNYEYYAGPVKQYGKGKCARYFGSHRSVRYTSPPGNCG